MREEDAGVPGKGSTFHLLIRAEPVTRPVVSRGELLRQQPQLAGQRVLAVDDNDTNRRILVLQVQSWGMQVRDSRRPREALEWIKRGDHFDVAILDMQMPDKDGVILARGLEMLGKEGRLDGAADTVARAETEYQRVRQALTELIKK